MISWSAWNLSGNPFFTQPLGLPDTPVDLLVGRENDIAEILGVVCGSDSHHTVDGARGIGATSAVNAAKLSARELGFASRATPFLVDGESDALAVMAGVERYVEDVFAREGARAGTGRFEAPKLSRETLKTRTDLLAERLRDHLRSEGKARRVLVHLSLGGINTKHIDSVRESLRSLIDAGMFSIPELRVVLEGPSGAVADSAATDPRIREQFAGDTILLPLTPLEFSEALSRRYAHLQIDPAFQSPPVDPVAALRLHEMKKGSLHRTFGVLRRCVSLLQRESRIGPASWADVERAMHTRGRL